MPEPKSHLRKRMPVVFGASFILQILSAVACFLAAVVLPLTTPEFAGLSAVILAILGCLFLCVAAINLFWGRRIARWAHWLGRRSRFVLPREGIVYLGVMLVLAVGGILGQSHGNRLLIVFGIMAGMFVFNGWCVTIMLGRILVERRLPPHARAGQAFHVELTARNRKPVISSRLIRATDSVNLISPTTTRLREAEPSVMFVRIPSQASRTGSYQLMLPRRGRYQFGPLRISSRFPLGIGERAKSVSETQTLIVHPKCGRLRPDWKRQFRMAESVARTRAFKGIHDDEFHQIREYRDGDNPRLIHWRSSARRGTLMLREFEQQRESSCMVLLDLFDCDRLTAELQETAVSLAATLCVEQSRQTASGNHCLLIAGQENVQIAVMSSLRFQQEALDALALATASKRADLAGSLMAAAEMITRNSMLMLITSRPEAARVLADSVLDELSSRGIWLHDRLIVIPITEESLSDIIEFPEATDLIAEESGGASHAAV
ncbi:MAG: DUF58 domain-containing protein [Planctomycetaceae bacterium]|nr:DUF58 domain-containing protein [Planctomycetaceae bacterium]